MILWLLDMSFYVFQVKTGGEDKYLRHAAGRPDSSELKIIWPRRNLRIRRRGLWLNSQASIFPGYLFLEMEEVTPELYWQLKRIPGFYRFLKDNQHIKPLSGRDKEILVHFLSYGEVVDRSLVTFDENKRIRVISGPLKNMEGRIVKVDRRKGRARVRLDLYEDSFLIDFGFDALEKTDKIKGVEKSKRKFTGKKNKKITGN